jgi:copper/silver efflux system protein
MRLLARLYRPLLRWALCHRVLTLAAAVLVLAGALALVARFGREFMPLLNEGDLMFMPIADPAISLPQALTITRLQNEAIQKVPKLAEVVAKVARADTSTSTDPAPLNMTETIVALKSWCRWFNPVPAHHPFQVVAARRIASVHILRRSQCRSRPAGGSAGPRWSRCSP